MGQGYHFTAESNAIYIAGTEFPMVCREYPLVFAKESTGKLVPVALLGLAQHQNLMLGADGTRLGNYIPAYIRRYPFILAHADEQVNSYAVCIDESYFGSNTLGAGSRLITDAGEHGEILANSVKFL